MLGLKRNLHGDIQIAQVKLCTSHTRSELQYGAIPGTHWYLVPATEQKLPLHERQSTVFVTGRTIYSLIPQAAGMIFSSDHSVQEFQTVMNFC